MITIRERDNDHQASHNNTLLQKLIWGRISEYDKLLFLCWSNLVSLTNSKRTLIFVFSICVEFLVVIFKMMLWLGQYSL
jgi:hypothetical protein